MAELKRLAGVVLLSYLGSWMVRLAVRAELERSKRGGSRG